MSFTREGMSFTREDGLFTREGGLRTREWARAVRTAVLHVVRVAKPALDLLSLVGVACGNTKGYSSTYLAMGFANVRAGTQKRPFCIAGRFRRRVPHGSPPVAAAVASGSQRRARLGC